MRYVFLSSTYYMDPAVSMLSEKAEILFIRSIAYCGNAETEGFLPLAGLPTLGIRYYLKYARELVDAGLWEVIYADSEWTPPGFDPDSLRSRSGFVSDSMRRSRYFDVEDDVIGFTLKSWDKWQVPKKKELRGGKAEAGALNEGKPNSHDVGDDRIKRDKKRKEERAIALSSAPAALATAELEALFDRWWTCYPRKVAKARARTVFEKSLNKVEFDKLLEATEKFSRDPNLPPPSEKQFIPHPATWLLQERWNDEPLPPRGSRSQIKKSATERASEYLGINNSTPPSMNSNSNSDPFSVFEQLALTS